MTVLRTLTVATCFAVIHQGTMPDRHLATLAAILIICAVIALDVSEARR